jgi:hypothetical protein
VAKAFNNYNVCNTQLTPPYCFQIHIRMLVFA